MYVVLIPFFLAANLSVDNSERWTYGPEFRYDGELSTTVQSKVEDNYSVRIMYSLRCRNRDSRTSVCFVANHTIEESEDRGPAATHMLKEELASPFEMHFDEKGLQSIVMSENSSTILNILHMITSQFSIGTNLKQRTTTPQFQVTELGMFGNCDTLYEVEVKPNDESSEESADRNNYDLLLIPYANLKLDMKFEIQKTRDVRSCTANSEMDNIVEGRSMPELSAYNSKIVVTNRGMFHSSAEFEHRRKAKRGPRLNTVVIRHLATLNLVDIVKANEPLEPIPDPKRYSINIYENEE